MRCWPELRDQRKITPCTAHALLAEEGTPSTCAVDLPALIGAFVAGPAGGTLRRSISISPGYLEDQGAIQLAHCGAAVTNWPPKASGRCCAPTCAPGPGPRWNFLQDRPGHAAKLMRPSGGKLKLAVAEGEVISSEGVRGR